MTVEFKVLKYKHQKQAKALSAKVEAGAANDDEVFEFVISLVKSWDFVDPETGEQLPVSPDIMDEVSLPQYNELMSLFNAQMSGHENVPKQNASE